MKIQSLCLSGILLSPLSCLANTKYDIKPISEMHGHGTDLVSYTVQNDKIHLLFKSNNGNLCWNLSGENKPYIIFDKKEKAYISSLKDIPECPSRRDFKYGGKFSLEFPLPQGEYKSFDLMEGKCAENGRRGCFIFKDIPYLHKSNDKNILHVEKEEKKPKEKKETLQNSIIPTLSTENKPTKQEAKKQTQTNNKKETKKTQKQATTHLPFTGNFTYSQTEAYKMSIKRLGKHIWNDEKIKYQRAKTSAKNSCKNINILGVQNFRLPYVKELDNLFYSVLYRLIKIGRYGFLPSRDYPISRNNIPKWSMDKLMDYHKKTYDNIKFWGKPYPIMRATPNYYTGLYTLNKHPYNLNLGKTITDREQGGTYNDFDTYCVLDGTMEFNNLYERILEYISKNLTSNIKMPTPPIKETMELTKGEFEKTVDFEKRKAEKMAEINKKFEEQMAQYNKEVAKKQQEIDNIKSNTNNYTLSQKAYKKAFMIYYGAPLILDIKYNADKEEFDFTVNLNGFNTKLSQQVPIDYAKKFKEFSQSKKFKPTLMVSVENNKFKITGIQEFLTPTLMVEKNELNKAFSSIEKLEKFIIEYPKSPFIDDAKKQKQNLEKQKALREQKNFERKLEREARQREKEEQKQKAYSAKKEVGDKICLDGRNSGFLGFGATDFVVSAYVERVNGNKIQLRIADTDGMSPKYNGVSLYKNTLIWDSYYNWRKCY